MTKNYRKEGSSYWIDIVGFLIGALVGVLLSYWCPKIPSLPSWYPALVFGLGTGFLGFFISVAYKLSYMKPAKEAEDYEKHQQELLRIIVPHISIVPMRDEHPLVFQLLSSYATRKVAHILERAELLNVEEYLFLLEESLKMATQHIFATSLILPSAWISNPDYRRYLDAQAERKYRIRQLQLKRVFICDPNEFNGDIETDNVVNLHKKSHMAMGFCDKGQLQRIGAEFCRDFVLFSTDKSKWAVDAGEISAAAKMDEMAKVRVCCSPKDMENFFETTIQRIKQRTKWLYCPRGE